MGKIILYGLGRRLHRYEKDINWENVVALTDSNYTSIECDTYKGLHVISPREITCLSFDFIVITTAYKTAKDIYELLTQRYGIARHKVVSINQYLGGVSYAMVAIPDICRKRNIRSLYDSDNLFWKHGILSDTNIYGEEIRDIRWGGKEDSEAVMVSVDSKEDLDKLLCDLQDYYVKYHYVMVLYTYDMVEYVNERKEILYIAEKVNELDCPMLIFKNPSYIRIYVVTHKSYLQPSDSLYETLWVGNMETCKMECRKESGDNISYLNAKINECTGLYWIWKNTSERIVGLNHYRRYFKAANNHEEFLTEQQAICMLEEYDIIVANACVMTDEVVYEQIKNSICETAYSEAYRIVYKAISNYQPEYLNTFNVVMEGCAMFPFNMFITRRKILEEYCTWLFSFLIPAAEAFDDSPYDSYSRRAIGFFAERMLTVWLLKQNYRIKELPVIQTVDD